MKKLVIFASTFCILSTIFLNAQAAGGAAYGSDPTGIVLRLIVILVFVIWGFLIIAFGQLMLAVREIALNTRNEKSESKSDYNVLLTVSKVNNFLGWVIIIAGLVVAIVVRF